MIVGLVRQPWLRVLKISHVKQTTKTGYDLMGLGKDDMPDLLCHTKIGWG